MKITWTPSSSGSTKTPYKSSPTPYKTYQTHILGKDIPITVLQSPETKSLLITKGNKPARLYLGMARAKDLCNATYTIASTKEFKKAINHKYIPEKNAISVLLIREPLSQSPFINTYMGSGFESRLYAVMDVHHVKDVKGLKGISGRVCSYKIDIPESKSKEIHEDIQLAIIYDSIAGGRNVIASIIELKKRFKNLEKVVLFSVYSTYQGSKRIASVCKKNKLACEFFCMHELLNASPLNEYDCFYPSWNISKEDEDILKTFYGEKYNKICIGGDWTANTLGKEQAIDVLESQLKDLNIEPKKSWFLPK